MASMSKMLPASYVGLAAVNAAFGMGLFGLPRNDELSDEYPTHVTPTNATFAIWGPIFLLQMGGTVLLAVGGDVQRMSAVGVPWVTAWFLECAWQGIFATAPRLGDATWARKLMTFGPCLATLLGAHAAMLTAGARLSNANDVEPRALGGLLVDFATGLNAGWLAAASGIGISLVAQHFGPMRPLATPGGAGALVIALSLYGSGASAFLGRAPHSVLVGFGYAAATAWALRGITKKEDVKPAVHRSARLGLWLAGAGAVASLVQAILMAPRRP